MRPWRWEGKLRLSGIILCFATLAIAMLSFDFLSFEFDDYTDFHMNRGHYAKILEAVQRFNQKISNDFKMMEEAQIKMSAPPAL